MRRRYLCLLLDLALFVLRLADPPRRWYGPARWPRVARWAQRLMWRANTDLLALEERR